MKKVIAGLGNPGAKYAHTRHNVGFMVLAALAGKLRMREQAATSHYRWCADDESALVQPLTYMNLSGDALRAWSVEQGVALTGEVGGEGLRPMIVCDDLSLPLGSLRFRARGSSGGQNGLASVIEQIGGDEFPRLRLGIAPLDQEVPAEYWADYVLAEFEPDEAENVAEMVDRATEALSFWLNNTFEATSSRFNRRIRPPD